MLKLISKPSLIVLITLCIYACQIEKTPLTQMPAPIETIVKTDQNESDDNALNRQMWIENMHLTAPGKNWRQIEYRNAKSKIQRLPDSRSDELVTLTDSLYTGYWEERGSSNQAGSLNAITYDKDQDKIYGISAGGTIWKGERDGSKWEVVNESFQFDVHSIFFIDKADGVKRMIATIARIPHYSDDMGLTWTPATGITSSGDFWSRTAAFETIELDDSSMRIYCLSKYNYSGSISLYYSDDLGVSYQLIENLGKDSFDEVAFCKPHGSNDILIGTSTPPNNFKINQINHDDIAVEPYLFSDVDVPSGEKVVLIGNYIGQDSVLYALENSNVLKVSKDAGKTWTNQASTETQSWEVGFYVCPSDATKVFYGEVEAFRMTSSGFQKVNNWWDYYDNVAEKLHADIMDFQEFETSSGDPFLLIGNHGGLSISYDYMVTTQNISLEGLNVAQYYDVRTDLLDPNIVYAGSQDQGFQRSTTMDQDGAVDFDQVISGDYGHITFSRHGEGMWMVYPGGSITYYNKPQTGNSIDGYTIDSPDESNWLTPMTDIPGSNFNEILVAGGTIDGSDGSHIIKLKYFAGIDAEQLPFDFKANTGGSVISAIEVSPINPDLIYVSTSDGSFFTSLDGGQTFDTGYNAINNGHYLYGTSIYASAINENEVWIAGSGYNGDGVLYSNDNGKNFSLFSNGLPPTLVFEIAANAEETQFFAATENGAYVYLAETGKWEDLSQGNAPVNTYWSVEYLEEQKIARFGTYGRGIWDFEFRDPIINVSTAELVDFEFVKAYPNPIENILYLDVNTTFEKLGTTLQISDMQGRVFFQKPLNEVGNTIDFSDYSSGTYTLQIKNKKQIQVEQLIKI